MRFVAIKSAEQQSILALHRTRALLVRQRIQLINMIRAQLAEFGFVLATGIQHALKLVDQLVEGRAPDIPALACKIDISLAEQIRALQARIATLEEDMKSWFRGNELAKRLKTIPGIGFITASALAASVTDPHQFTSGRQFAAFRSRAFEPAKQIGTRSAYTIRASGIKTPRQQAGHKTVPDSAAMPPKSPCNAEAIHTRPIFGTVFSFLFDPKQPFGNSHCPPNPQSRGRPT